LIVVAIAIEIAAKRGFSGTRCRLDEVEMTFLELHILVPDIGIDMVLSGKDFGKGIL
jgi:hypothetical protein